MSKVIRTSPLSLAKAIVSAHKRWSKLTDGESFAGPLLRALAREGRRSRLEALQHLQSAAGRLPTDAPGKGTDFATDCEAARDWEAAVAIRAAIGLLSVMPAAVQAA
jgi:hypothetical protein